MTWMPAPRLTNLLIALVAALAMAAALYLQHVDGLEPCPLCIFQRIAVMATGLVALAAALHGPGATGRRIYGGLTALAATVGLIVAGRHVWLQHLPPDQVPSCGPGLDYWLEALPLKDVVQQVFRGSGECAKVDWTLLGLSLPEWTLMMFAGLLLAAGWQMLRRD